MADVIVPSLDLSKAKTVREQENAWSPRSPSDMKSSVKSSSSSSNSPNKSSSMLHESQRTKKKWRTPSPAFVDKSPRFMEPKSNTPAVGSYSPHESPVKDSRPSSAFSSKSPRLHEAKRNSPPPTQYSPDFPKHHVSAAPSMRSTSPRFIEEKTSSPSATQYNPISPRSNSFRDVPAFKSTVKRFSEPKPQTPSPTQYTTSPEQRFARIASMVSTTPRFKRDKNTTTPSPTSYEIPTTFSPPKHSPTAFGSTSPRFREEKKTGAAIGPGSYEVSKASKITSRPTTDINGSFVASPCKSVFSSKQKRFSDSFKTVTPAPGAYDVSSIDFDVYTTKPPRSSTPF